MTKQNSRQYRYFHWHIRQHSWFDVLWLTLAARQYTLGFHLGTNAHAVWPIINFNPNKSKPIYLVYNCTTSNHPTTPGHKTAYMPMQCLQLPLVEGRHFTHYLHAVVQGYVMMPASNQKSCSRNHVSYSLPPSICFSSSCQRLRTSVNPPSAIQNWRRRASVLENCSVHNNH